MAKTIILNEGQLSKMSRIDEVVGGLMDKIRAVSDDGKRGFQQDKERNRQIRNLRAFVHDLYAKTNSKWLGQKNGAVSMDLYKRVRKAVSKRIWQIQAEIKGHGLDFDGQSGSGNVNGSKNDFYPTKQSLEEWRKYLQRKGIYGPKDDEIGPELYNAMEECLKMEIGRRDEFFYDLEKKIKPLMATAAKKFGFTFNG